VTAPRHPSRYADGGRPPKAPPVDPAGHVRGPIAAVRKPLRLLERWGRVDGLPVIGGLPPTSHTAKEGTQ